MRHRILLACAGLFASAWLAGCVQAPKPLYSWESFPRTQYEFLQRSGATPGDQIRAMETHAQLARDGGAALPPGFRAHLGMLYLSVGNGDGARDMWIAEKTAFPESAPYIDRLLQRLGTPAQPKAKENPA